MLSTFEYVNMCSLIAVNYFGIFGVWGGIVEVDRNEFNVLVKKAGRRVTKTVEWSME